jgi:hypothetical protein
MLWVLFFTAALMLVSSQAYKPWSEVSVRSKWLLAFLILALTFVAGGGMVQASVSSQYSRFGTGHCA